MTNELMVAAAGYPLFYFTPWVTSLDSQTNAGWSLIACLILNVLFNMVIISSKVVVAWYVKIKYGKARKIA